MRHSARAQPALARLSEIDPAISALALWCTYRDSDEPTATQGDTILVGPELPLLPISEQTGVIAHHVLHVALRHSSRRSAAQERYGARFRAIDFDLACDALVNEALLQAGHALPRPAVRAADIVAMLPVEERPENVLKDWDADRLYAEMVAHLRGVGGPHDKPLQEYARAQGFTPDLKGDDPFAKDAEIWAGRVEQALATGRFAGLGIGATLFRFGDLPNAVVPWEIRLRRLLNKALAPQTHRSHRRPARGWLARDAQARHAGGVQPVFEPGLAREQRRPRLVIGLDTSSSISEAVLAMFAAEAISMVRSNGAEAHILGFDTEVHCRARFDHVDRIKTLSMRRGGGTDFGPVFAEAETLDPSIVVMLTDLDAPVPEGAFAPFVWLVPAGLDVQPPFGKVLFAGSQPQHMDRQI